ncbi:hypothetical protein M1146_06865 [Patescibacteria group bacterium]|nr:hypothetical protein [Patescibacteria group bacterium]
MKKNDSSQPVTKKYLDYALKKFATKDDLKNYPTKIDLANSFKKYRDDILTKIDEVMGELQTMREENTIGTYQTRELREQVDDHEKRIIKLETP